MVVVLSRAMAKGKHSYSLFSRIHKCVASTRKIFISHIINERDISAQLQESVDAPAADHPNNTTK